MLGFRSFVTSSLAQQNLESWACGGGKKSRNDNTALETLIVWLSQDLMTPPLFYKARVSLNPKP